MMRHIGVDEGEEVDWAILLLQRDPEEALYSFHAMNKVLMKDDTWRQYDRAIEDLLIERRNAAKQSQYTFNYP